MALGNTIRKYRLRQKMSQEDLAKELGLSSGQFISNIERGISPLPPSQYKLLAKLLRVSETLLIREAVKDFRNFLIQQSKRTAVSKPGDAPKTKRGNYNKV